jgi:hypothetical protein
VPGNARAGARTGQRQSRERVRCGWRGAGNPRSTIPIAIAARLRLPRGRPAPPRTAVTASAVLIWSATCASAATRSAASATSSRPEPQSCPTAAAIDDGESPAGAGAPIAESLTARDARSGNRRPARRPA